MKQKVRQIGNSLGILIPAKTVKELKLKKGSEVEVSFGSSVTKSKVLPIEEKRDRFEEAHRKVMDKYSEAFEELANR
jgi:putative addiction module antidote